ncbi:MAG: RNA polymerase factor sigma-54 [Brevinematia bacterium]
MPVQVLLQTTNLLGLPIIELENYVKMELEENPFLEIDEEKNLTSIDYNITKEELDEEDTNIGEITDTYEISQIKEIELQKRRTFKPIALETIISESETLQEHLLFQAKLDFDDERLFTLATYIIYELDDDGFFRGNIENLKNIENYTFSEEEIEEVRNKIKRYDPVGCGSKTLEEALVTQLEVYYNDFPQKEIIKKIIENDLTLLAKDSKTLQKKYNLSEDELENIKTIIKSLNPKPAVNFSKTPSFIIPEAIVKKTNNDDLDIEFNDSFIPILKLKIDYIDAVKNIRSKEIKEKINMAKNMILSLEYRKNLVSRIIEKIVNHQKQFILGKQNFLNPLTIEDISNELKVAISTVSRAVKDKFILTPIGLLPLKYFFSRASKSMNEQEVSTDKVKKMIKEIIESEEKPLSDEKITSILINKGIKISRRTVTKYREEMLIPPAHKRKK